MSEPRGHWRSNTGFILAATGSAIGLGNLWKFPFITWENNGGAFVLVYLVCIAAVGLPIMMAELLIGRATQKSVVGALKEAMGPAWGCVGLWGVFCGFLLLSYYTVIAGWSIGSSRPRDGPGYFAKSTGWAPGTADPARSMRPTRPRFPRRVRGVAGHWTCFTSRRSTKKTFPASSRSCGALM